MQIIVGLAQLLVEGGEPDRNIQRAIQMLDEAKKANCDIVLLPECMDLAWTHPSVKNEAEKIPGPRSTIFCEYAKNNKIYICLGLTELENGKTYNTALLINDNGEIILKYRKINCLEVEFPYYEIGQTLNVVDTPFGKIGVNICADNYMDGLAIGHTLARMGAQIILSPSSWTVDFSITEADDPYGEKWIKPYSILATLYNLAILGTTSVGVIVGGPYEGKKMIGCSLAMGKNGILAQGSFNEFASKLITVNFTVPSREEKGTAIGKMLKQKKLPHSDSFL